MRRRGIARTIGLIIAAVAVIGTLWYALGRPAVGWPDESRRVAHPAGFSIVAPEDWERHVSFNTDGHGLDGLRFLPARAVGNPGYFTITQLPAAVTETALAGKGYKPATFAGKPAWERTGEYALTHDHSRSLIFERDGRWFDISLRRPDSEALDIGIWRAYAETFRIEAVKTFPPGLPSTLPATLP